MKRAVKKIGRPIAAALWLLLVDAAWSAVVEPPTPRPSPASPTAPRMLVEDARYRVWWEGFEPCPKCTRGQHTLALRIDDKGTNASHHVRLDEGFEPNPNYAQVAARIVDDRVIVTGVGYRADKVVVLRLSSPFPVVDRRGCDGMTYSRSGAWLACPSEIPNRRGWAAVTYQTKVVLGILDLTVPTLPWRVVYPPENVASQNPDPNLPRGVHGTDLLSQPSWSPDDKKLVFFESSPKGPELVELDLSAGLRAPVIHRRRLNENELTGMTEKERDYGFTVEGIEWLSATELRVKLPGGYPHCGGLTVLLPSVSRSARPTCLPHERWDLRRDGETPARAPTGVPR